MSPITVGFYVFFALVFTAYWSVSNATARSWLLLSASYAMYAMFDPRFLALLAGATVVGFVVGHLIESGGGERRSRVVLSVGLALCLAALGVFKYLDFFMSSATSLLQSLGLGADKFTLGLALPIGISFYLFKVMAYMIDVYRGRLPATRSALDFATYVAFFPQLLAGPIDRPADLLPQIATAREFDYALAVRGSQQVLWGLFKKVALADGLAWSVEKAFGDWRAESGPVLFVGAALFSFQIYCDFSGYTDISSGLSKLLGFNTVRNFAYPYFSQSVAEFWRRWNISVSCWFRDYVYIPLGGSRVSKPRLVVNIMLTFLLSGLWHGASVTFMVWGAMLGLAVCYTGVRRRTVLRMKVTPGGESLTLPAAGRMLATFVFITLSWVFFRAATVDEALGILGGMLSWPLTAGAWAAPLALFPGTRMLLLVALISFVAVEWLQRRRECPLDLTVKSRTVRWLAYSVVVWMTIVLAQPSGSGRFIYFDF